MSGGWRGRDVGQRTIGGFFNPHRIPLPYAALRSLTILCTLLLLIAGLLPASASAQDATIERKIKAAYLYNFAKFIEWPASSFSDAAAPFRMCVVGNAGLAELLGEVNGRELRERKISVLQFSSAADAMRDAASCQVLYGAAGQESVFEDNAAALRSAGVLTVSDSPNVGVITFRIVSNTVKFDVDLALAKTAGLQISSRLLTVASEVKQ